MIRVNLIGVREPSTGVFDAGAPAAPSEKKGLLVAVLLLALSLGFIGWQWFTARNTIANLDEEIQQLTQEKARLQAIIQRVNEYQQKLLELEKREKLIERLKREREGPVRMLDDISAQLPDFVWLTNLDQGANNVSIRGMASSYVSIADYIQRLEESEYFANVELIDAQRGREEFTSFQLQAQVVTPGGGAEATPAGTTGAQ
jgi:Tfp pilus assembly protein PilN